MLLIIILTISCGRTRQRAGELTERVDRAIDSTEVYDAAKLARIDSLRIIASATEGARRVDANRRLFREYEAMTCDSAMRYLNDNLAIARDTGDGRLLAETSIYKAQILSRAGLFNEAMELLQSLDMSAIPRDLLDEFYLAKHDLYQFMIEFVDGTDYAEEYAGIARELSDSIMAYVDPGSFVEDITRSGQLYDSGKVA